MQSMKRPIKFQFFKRYCLILNIERKASALLADVYLFLKARTKKLENFQTLEKNSHKTMNALQKFALAVHKNSSTESATKSSIKSSMLPIILNANRLLNLLRFYGTDVNLLFMSIDRTERIC